MSKARIFPYYHKLFVSQPVKNNTINLDEFFEKVKKAIEPELQKRGFIKNLISVVSSEVTGYSSREKVNMYLCQFTPA